MFFNHKLFISTYPFGKYDKSPVELLEQTGINFSINPLNRKLTSAEVLDFAKDCTGIIAGTENLERLVSESKNLKFISRVGIGLDSVPLKLCRHKGILVSYTPDAVTLAVAEIVLGMMITLPRHVVFADRQIRNGGWTRPVGISIQSSVIGIVGLGRVGYKISQMLTSLKPKKILVCDILDKSEDIKRLRAFGLDIEQVTLNSLLSFSDIVSVHVPLTPLTQNLIATHELKQMKKSSFLINFSRGGVVNESSAYESLKKNEIAGLALDVYEKEPYSGNLIELDNVVLTQHMGSCSFDCRLAMESQATEELIRFFKGEKLMSEVPDFEFENSPT
ncbi:phosphoglycerate dehydrogenase [Leptospira terpstrae]|uniref:4-phosphoerythronate dehydrogenase n=1 Tax=Leptospira terpstrae serovar Hualin str. LT 11-33 = ATCC 700639 TaxID=1257025 RepID=N1VXJ7_9LEPT|nr:phosphoglycerate dehydrogenase [Leptospira terpstrae]EMY61780.1 4-phosphoerythronate dehydrogenase [Leptospira terpstrae serovar Hualin str. LT 11-33 = ATCC 700639]